MLIKEARKGGLIVLWGIFFYFDKMSKIHCSVSEAACSSDVSETEGPTSCNSYSGLVHEFYLCMFFHYFA